MNLDQRRLEIFDIAKSKALLSQESMEKFHGRVPQNVRILVRDFRMDKKRVLDLGCSFGNSLLYWGEGSEGVDINEKARTFLEHFGIKTYALNVEEGFEGISTRYEVVYTNNLIEHLLAPNLFLVRLHRLLEPQGILAVGHPLAPVFPFDKIWMALGFKGWLAPQHINFFSIQGISHTLRRAGFKILRQYFKPLDRLRIERIPWLRDLLAPSCPNLLSVCQKEDEDLKPPKGYEAFQPKWAMNRNLDQDEKKS